VGSIWKINKKEKEKDEKEIIEFTVVGNPTRRLNQLK
jgi:hypothetical protein